MALPISSQQYVSGLSATGRKAAIRALYVACLLAVAGCKQGGTGISEIQLGNAGNNEGFVGQELPITARVSAHAAIDYIDIEIQPQAEDGWTFKQRYTEGMAGGKSVIFKAGVAVPAVAEAGDYRLVLRATDADGDVIEATAVFKLSIDSTVPTASDLEVGINKAGNDLHLEAELTAPAGIAKVKVEIKGDAWRDEFTFSGKELAGQLTHHFHEHVHVGEAPGGTYTVIMTVVDRQGREYRTEGTFTK